VTILNQNDKIHAVDIINVQRVFQYLDGIVLDAHFSSGSILYSSAWFFQSSREDCAWPTETHRTVPTIMLLRRFVIIP
jgi:hypothetical protein